MKLGFNRTFVILGAAALTSVLLAQSGPMAPPPVMLFMREDVKPGKGAAHEASESAWAKAMAKGKSTNYYLGMSSLSGPSQALFIAGYASFAEWQAKFGEIEKNAELKKEIGKIADQDGDLLSETRDSVGTLRKDLSYGPPVEIGKMRYMRVRTFRVKQGQGRAFEEGLKVALDGYTKSKYPFSFAIYEVVAGQPSPTFIGLRPMKSLADMDAADAADKAFIDAVGEEGRKSLNKTFADCVQSVENQLFALSPGLSYVGPGTKASDPAFWEVK
jgi:hypothetical protein